MKGKADPPKEIPDSFACLKSNPISLKRENENVEVLNSMIRLTLMNGAQIVVPREDALELLPYEGVFSNPQIKAPVDGVMCHRGKIIPVLGPLPSAPFGKSLEERPWLLRMNGYAQAIQGLPEFEENTISKVAPPLESEKTFENQLLNELDDLLKTA
jgi:hypothetical protein